VAERISGGDLRQRVTVRDGGDDLDHLGMTLNHMLDRITTLMESLRQVSNDVAHDLRTPLTRLRQRLEIALGSQSETDRTAAIEGAIGDLDAALETFAAMLRIAQIESGGRRAGFTRLNLTVLAREVVESFAPSAEDDGRSLRMEGHDDVEITGDSELLTQLIVNLVENSLRHTPVGSAVQVGVVSLGHKAILRVTDNGPGIPAAERAHVFKRFYRLEAGRTTPSNGLGLSIVSAIAKLHGTTVVLSDGAPGLEARVRFPLAPAQRSSPATCQADPK
jgi:signal transduction histidine kinase